MDLRRSASMPWSCATSSSSAATCSGTSQRSTCPRSWSMLWAPRPPGPSQARPMWRHGCTRRPWRASTNGRTSMEPTTSRCELHRCPIYVFPYTVVHIRERKLLLHPRPNACGTSVCTARHIVTVVYCGAAEGDHAVPKGRAADALPTAEGSSSCC